MRDGAGGLIWNNKECISLRNSGMCGVVARHYLLIVRGRMGYIGKGATERVGDPPGCA